VNPTVSILIPVRDGGPVVGRAIASALAQTLTDVEVIVYDDGSSDDTLEAIRSFGDRIRWESGPPLGSNHARNRLLQLSRGEWLQYLDADDEILPEKLEKQLAAVDSDAIDLVVSPCVDQAGERLHEPNHPDAWTCWLRTRLGVTSANLFRRSAVVRARGWDEGRIAGQEYALMRVMMSQGSRVAFVPEPLALKHRGSPSSIWRREPDLARGAALENVIAATRFLIESSELSPERAAAAGGRLLKLARAIWKRGDPRWQTALGAAHELGITDRQLLADSSAPYRLGYRCLGFERVQTLTVSLARRRQWAARGFRSLRATRNAEAGPGKAS
jgi:cellulose synthase/poly-beta-1,6-N-acetylglucosamine synthase-like glycosyltransferase